MLFRKKHPRSCAYCAHGTKMDEARILCIKRGVVSIEHACRKFAYDPCKRVPPKVNPPDFNKYKDVDFSL